METESRLVVVWDWGKERKKGVDMNRYGVYLGGADNVLKIYCVDSYNSVNVQKKTIKLYILYNREIVWHATYISILLLNKFKKNYGVGWGRNAV